MEKRVSLPTERRSLLERAATAAGDLWATDQIDALRADHRRIVGGFPGTMGEARGRSRAQVMRALGSAATTVTAQELETAARATYAHARKVWQARTEPESPDLEEAT
jgi:hypothetical protein